MSNISEMLEEYVLIAEHIDNEELKIKPYKEALGNIKEALLAQMNQLELNSLKSTAGHAITRVKAISAKVVDAEAFYNFVFESGDTTFLTKHVAKDAVDAYMDDHEGECPPGITSEAVTTIRFTKAKK